MMMNGTASHPPPSDPATTAVDQKSSSTGSHKNHQLATSNPSAAAIPIIPVVKDYAWGIRGMDSRVGRYALECKAIEQIDADCPYAELWIGTHPAGPAKLLLDGNTTAAATAPYYLQDAIGGELPFLFKILSAGKALSIQAHPDKDGAVRLHSDDPTNYGDANHKPEMAIALTPFEAMCGFRRIHEISVLIKKHPEFAACLTEEAKLAVFLASNEEQEKVALQKMFHSFMTCEAEKSERQLQLLLLRLQAEQAAVHPHPHDEPPVRCITVFYISLWLTCLSFFLFPGCHI
jgi:mannose-6-phosphate isomerase